VSNAQHTPGWSRGLILALAAIAWGWLPDVSQADGFSVTPPTVKLEGNFAQAQLLVRAGTLDKHAYIAQRRKAWLTSRTRSRLPRRTARS